MIGEQVLELVQQHQEEHCHTPLVEALVVHRAVLGVGLPLLEVQLP